MEKGNIPGLMVENMKDNIRKIANMDTEPILGQMEENIKETGLMANKKALASTSHLMGRLDKEFGKMEKESNGLHLINRGQKKKTNMKRIFERAGHRS